MPWGLVLWCAKFNDSGLCRLVWLSPSVAGISMYNPSNVSRMRPWRAYTALSIGMARRLTAGSQQG